VDATDLSDHWLSQTQSKLNFISDLIYNKTMKMNPASLEVLFNDAIRRDRTTARRVALFTLLQHERYLTREQLIVRVEGILGKGCFGESAWTDTFFRDMQVVKLALCAASCELLYSRRLEKPGYYIHNQPAISSELSAMLDGSVADVDRSQIEIFKQLSFAQRFQQGCSISNLARQVVANRIQQQNPQISRAEAQRQALQRSSIP
jgi:hypothetical protein